MTTPRWQLQSSINAVIFDCDGTLSSIEGIDQLASVNGVGEQVKQLTAKAMGETGINPELYKKRLELVHPTKDQVQNLGAQYFEHISPDAFEVIQIFKRLNKSIYLISAGLLPPVSFFGEMLKIPKENIFAVDISFDKHGNYADYDRESSLVRRDGKRDIVTQINLRHENAIYIGDGLNDLAVKDLVSRFIGYGGSYFRENIAEKCQFYINTPSMSPIVPLSLTLEEYENLNVEDKLLFQKGLDFIEKNKVFVN